MGRALAKLGWPRHSYLVSTKFYWGIHDGPNTEHTLNRKYLLDAIEGSLERFELDFVDIVYCHRADPQTAIEETVWAMHDIVERAGPLLGHQRVARRRHPAPWGRPSATACANRSSSSPSTTWSKAQVEEEFVRLYEDLGSGSPPGAAGVGCADRQVRRWDPRAAGQPARLRVAA